MREPEKEMENAREVETAMKEAKSALRNLEVIVADLPSAQPETHDKRTKTHACDCISRQAAIDAHYEYCNKHPDASFPVWSLKILENLPSAQPDLEEDEDIPMEYFENGGI